MSQNLYCQETDVINLLSQAGVDLRQDDPVPMYVQTSTFASYVQPAPAMNVVVSVGNGLWAFVGQQVGVVGGGLYTVFGLSAGSLTLTNTGRTGNAPTGATVAFPANVSGSPPGGFLQDFIERGSNEMDEYCAQMYDSNRLGDSVWVRKECSIVTAFLYCARRGNPPPPGIALLYERTIKKLERVQRGGLMIPNLPRRKACVPVMSNMRPALRPHPHAVVETMRSTGQPANFNQNVDPFDRTGWNNSFVYDYYLSLCPLLAGALMLAFGAC